MNSLFNFLSENYVSISITIGLVVIYTITRAIASRLISAHSEKNNIAYERGLYIRKLSNAFLTVLFATVLGAAWEISIQGLSLYFASIFTVIGVALFAHWSILSNLTASVILFFFFPYRVGHRIKIVDGDNSIEGKILDVTFFFVKIETDDGASVAYPNNLAIQKPVLQSGS